MAGLVHRSGRYACLAAALLPVAPLLASGLQVEPVSVTIADRSEIIALSNAGDAPLQAQVRVYRWTQGPDGDRLEPTGDLVASPPMLRVPTGGRQVVRLVSTAAAGCNDTYRLAIDEIPQRAPARSGLRYVLHYSVPVFVTRRDCKNLAPRLDWRLETAGGRARLLVGNSGTLHAQLAKASFIDSRGHRTELTPGLLGYVLPGSTMAFALAPAPATFAGGGKVEVMVNGQIVTHLLPVG